MATPTSKARTNGMTKNKPAGATKPAMKPTNPALSKLTSWVRSTLLNDKFGFRTVEEVRTVYLEQFGIRSPWSEQALDDYNVENLEETASDKDWDSGDDFLGTLDLIIFVEN